MLESLRGVLVEKQEDSAVLEVSGIGFRLEIPASTAEALPAVGGEALLYTRLSLSVNDGTFLLFGFATTLERECFEIFTGISGIGPRKGLMILSQVEIASFANAVVHNDLNYLSKIKGVGKKTAERMVVDLREKMVPYTGPSSKDARPSLPANAVTNDAIEALVVLGCRPAVAERAVAAAIEELGEDAPTEQLIRVALRHR